MTALYLQVAVLFAVPIVALLLLLVLPYWLEHRRWSRRARRRIGWYS